MCPSEAASRLKWQAIAEKGKGGGGSEETPVTSYERTSPWPTLPAFLKAQLIGLWLPRASRKLYSQLWLFLWDLLLHLFVGLSDFSMNSEGL